MRLRLLRMYGPVRSGGDSNTGYAISTTTKTHTHTHTRAPTMLKSSNLGNQPLHREAPIGPIHPTYTLPPPYHTTKGRPRALQSGGARGTGMPYPPGNTKPRLHRKGYDFRPPYLRRHRRESRLRLRLRLPPRRQG